MMQSGKGAALGVLLVLLQQCPPSSAQSGGPSWWYARGVIATNQAAADYAPALLGQLKWMATNAYDELQEALPGGAGTNLTAVVSGFSSINNASVVNAGQLKWLAAQFYARLIEAGCATSYPWTATATDDVDRAAVNIGQMKCMFGFDLGPDLDDDGLLDWTETGTGLFVSPYDTGTSPTNSDYDGDGISDGDEVDNRTDPTSGDTNAPIVVINFPQEGSRWVLIP